MQLNVKMNIFVISAVCKTCINRSTFLSFGLTFEATMIWVRIRAEKWRIRIQIQILGAILK
jgi:hypothetical protein